ncbi:MAG: inositol monophosphatase family protein [Galactobacter sp.]|uniref:inositol monophosphatase family protein n=1 Tax=Galactobacter sp. TaxID=2676125 RepID=UPI0025C0A414|nr:inositol monophosphatase family protein [Galactobacter sp.]
MSTEPTPRELLDLALTAAGSGAAILAERTPLVQSTGLVAADDKSAAGDWVTDFDRAAERAVRETIAAARPDDTLTGEEYPDSVGGDGYRWSIDPLDGTVNFVRGIAYYATSVAVSGPVRPTPMPDGSTPEGAEPATAWLAGVVAAPALGVVYLASRGGGAWKAPWPLQEGIAVGHTDQEAPLPGAVRLTGPDASNPAKVLSTGFGYDAARREVQVRALAQLLPDFVNVRRIGSAALDLCLVAEGAIDAYAELGGHEWDWAAGALIAEEAGVPVVRGSNDAWTSAGAVDVADLPVA